MSDLGDTLAKQVGPLPLGVWLLVGAGGLVIARQQSRADAEDVLTKEVQQVPVPVGAIASPDGAPTVLNVVIYNPLPEKTPDAVTPTPTVPPPSTTPPGSLPFDSSSIKLPAPTRTIVTTPAVKTPAKVPAKAPVKTPAKAPAVRTYTIVSGDTLSGIGARFGKAWQTIYAKNTAVIEAAARSHGRVSSSNGHWIYPGTKLVIP